jgi:predicted choloylglycine hydrolase
LKTFSGSHYEVGVQQGKAASDLIHAGLKRIPRLEIIKLLKPRLLPTSLFLALAKRRATKLLKDDIFRYYPQQAERLEGIAEGAQVDLPTLLLLQSMELLIGRPSFTIQGCTTLGFTPQRTTTSEPIIGKNFDYLNELAPYHLTCLTKPTNRYTTLGCTIASFPGILDGMNEQGLTVTYNLANTTDEPHCFVPLSMVLQEMLETCGNTQEASEYLTRSKRGGHDALLTLADADGNLTRVEITSRHIAVREIHDDYVVNTNHYHTPEMRRYEIPPNAVYSGQGVPEHLVGVPVHQSSEQRLTRAEGLLKNAGRMDEDKLAQVLRDHGANHTPSNLTICQHGPLVSSTRSMICYPQRQSIKLLYGKPCQNEYAPFNLS